MEQLHSRYKLLTPSPNARQNVVAEGRMLLQGAKATAITAWLCVLFFFTEAAICAQAVDHHNGNQAKPNLLDEHAKPSPASEGQKTHPPPDRLKTQNGHVVPPEKQFNPNSGLIPKGSPIHTLLGLAPVHLSPAEAKSRGDSRKAWESAVDYEKQSRKQPGPDTERKASQRLALIYYEQSVDALEQTKNSQGPLLAPGTYVPLAKSHLDAARMLYLLGENSAADNEVLAAVSLLRDLLLNQDSKNPLPRAWLWRIYYLLGDANLYESNAPIALFDYQKAQSLNPDFAPASAMAQYLAGAVPPEQIASMPAHQASAAPASTPVNLTAREELLQEMEAISAAKALNQAASFVSVAATLLEATELAPFAAALTLSGMIIDYAVEVK